MSDKACEQCGNLFGEGDRVRFIGVGTFHVLKSKVCYALERDFTVEDVKHQNCQYPKTGEPEGD